jgi:hypothetical protein
MTLHTKISYAKSAFRIIGYIVLMFVGNPIITSGSACLLLAELLGVAEELPGAYKGTNVG